MAIRSSTSIGVVVSLALHAGFAATLLRYGDQWLAPASQSVQHETPLLIPIPPAPTAPPRPEETIPDPLKLGIDDGRTVGDTWLGFRDPNPHSGPVSSRDQAQLVKESPSAPSPASDEQPPSPPTPEVQPSTETTASPPAQPEPAESTPSPEGAKPASQAEPIPEAAQPASLEPAESAKPAPIPTDPKSDQVEPGERLVLAPAPEQNLPEARTPEIPLPIPAPETKAEQSPEAKPDAKPESGPEIPKELKTDPDAKELPASPAVLVGPPSPSPQDLAEREKAERERAIREIAEREAAQAAPPIPPRPTGKPRPARRAGEVSDREADAAAVRSAINVDPGRPAATKGLKINTVRPEWSTTTRIVALPKNPVVRVRFNRAGKVVDASFVDRYDTGWPDVDGPLLDAMYRWKAEGERLRELPENEPDAVITVTFRITLRTGI